MNTLLIGYGNQGRGDDGLGPEFAARLEDKGLQGLTIDADYQLTVDHALMVAEADVVVFVDAAIGSEKPYFFDEAKPSENASISSHELSPSAVLSLCKTLYSHEPKAHILGIAGYVYGDIREGLSAEALHNLELAEAFFLDWYSELTTPA